MAESFPACQRQEISDVSTADADALPSSEKLSTVSTVAGVVGAASGGVVGTASGVVGAAGGLVGGILNGATGNGARIKPGDLKSGTAAEAHRSAYSARRLR